MNTELYTKRFKGKYGDSEIELSSPVITVYDNHSDPFSSGSNGYITKARVKNDVLEFYHDWWDYGWYSYKVMCEKYPDAVGCVLRELGL